MYNRINSTECNGKTVHSIYKGFNDYIVIKFTDQTYAAFVHHTHYEYCDLEVG